ncbi:MAG: hypothetical protein HOW73_48900 [Polyangiaceae bacterium]|nr:hypothetical protein [Polyangiaceae bacterium]
MRQNESEAHRLVSALANRGIDARVEGGGVHWQVDISPVAERALRVHCFGYDRVISGLMLGMNPGNSRSSLGPADVPREGPEFYVTIQNGESTIASGRTGDRAEVITCAVAWLSGVSAAALEEKAPFVNERRRAMQAIACRLDERLQWEIGGDPSFELWVYGGNDRAACAMTHAVSS